MTFDAFCKDAEELAKEHRKAGESIRFAQDPRRNIARAYGAGLGPVEMAKSGLDEISELASDAAEHHPYWAALAGCSAILETVLERWDGKLSAEDQNQIRWDIGRIQRVLEED